MSIITTSVHFNYKVVKGKKYYTGSGYVQDGKRKTEFSNLEEMMHIMITKAMKMKNLVAFDVRRKEK